MNRPNSEPSASALRDAHGGTPRATSVAKALLAALALGIAGTAGANDVTEPVLIEQPQPGSPPNQCGWPLEGWVKVRYTVRADGTPTGIRVIEAMPPTVLTKSAVAAV